MNTYSVREIADMLGTNPETVRRWIRNGTLDAVQESRKVGNAVTETALQKFLNSKPKYADIAAGGIVTTGITIAAIGALVGSRLIKNNKNENVSLDGISQKQLLDYLNTEIEELQSSIDSWTDEIKKLEEKIKTEKEEISRMKKTMFTIENYFGNENTLLLEDKGNNNK